MFCHKCGYELPENSKFCPKCGSLVAPTEKSEVKSDASSSATSPTQTQYTTTPDIRFKGLTYIIKDEKYKALTKFAIASCVVSLLSLVILNKMIDLEKIYSDIVMNRWSYHIKYVTYGFVLEAISILIPYFIALKDMSTYIGADTGIIVTSILKRLFFPWRKPQITGSFEENYTNDYMRSKYQLWFVILPFPVIFPILMCIVVHLVI